MPFHLPPLSRRRFLTCALAAGAGLVLRRGWAAEADPDHWALLSDPHIAAGPGMVKSGVNMTEHLRRAVAEVLARAARPAGVILNGDCAFLEGLPEDYANV